jgi:predicted alpha/beta superfamily hydrolase
MSGENDHNDKASTVRVPLWIGIKKRGKNRGDVKTEAAQTAKVHNGELNQQQKQTTFNSVGNQKNEMDVIKPSTCQLVGLFRNKGLVRIQSLGEIKAKE